MTTMEIFLNAIGTGLGAGIGSYIGVKAIKHGEGKFKKFLKKTIKIK